MFLTPDELAELTGRSQKAAQCRVLRHWGLPYLIRPDGTPVVLKAVLEATFGHATANKGPAPARPRIQEARRLLVRQKGQMDPARG